MRKENPFAINITYDVQLYEDNLIFDELIGEISYSHIAKFSASNPDESIIERTETRNVQVVKDIDIFNNLMYELNDVSIAPLFSDKNVFVRVRARFDLKGSWVLGNSGWGLSLVDILGFGYQKETEWVRSDTIGVTVIERPEPDLTYTLSNSSINLGDSAVITVECTNRGGKANEFSTISLSFPELGEVDDDEQVDIISHDFHVPKCYIQKVLAEDTVWSINDNDIPITKETSAEYLLVEGGTSRRNAWDAGERHHIEVLVTPEQPGEFDVYIRATFTSLNDAGNVRQLFNDPVISDDKDQQNYAVYHERIMVVGDAEDVEPPAREEDTEEDRPPEDVVHPDESPATEEDGSEASDILENATFEETVADDSIMEKPQAIVPEDSSVKEGVLGLSTTKFMDIEWHRSFDWRFDVQETEKGGFIIGGGPCFSDETNEEAWLIKLSSEGEKVYNRSIRKSELPTWVFDEDEQDVGSVDVRSHDGNLHLIKANSVGDEVWNRTFGGSYYDGCYGDCNRKIFKTSDDGYIVLGTTESFGSGKSDIWSIKTDSEGKELWNKTYGGYSWDTPVTFQKTSDGGFIILGTTGSYGAGNDDVWLIKTDSDGNLEWDLTLGGIDYDWGYLVLETSDGGYLVRGATFGEHSSHTRPWTGPNWLVKLSKPSGLSDVEGLNISMDVIEGDPYTVVVKTPVQGASVTLNAEDGEFVDTGDTTITGFTTRAGTFGRRWRPPGRPGTYNLKVKVNKPGVGIGSTQIDVTITEEDLNKTYVIDYVEIPSSKIEWIIRGPVAYVIPTTYLWGPQEFAGFDDDLDSNVGSEIIELKMYDNLSTTILYSIDGIDRFITYPNNEWEPLHHEKDDNVSLINFTFPEWGAYWAFKYLGEEYFAGYVKDYRWDFEENYLYWDSTDETLIADGGLSKVLIDENEEKVLTPGMALKLEEGYEIKLIGIDLEDKCWLELYKNGDYIQCGMVEPGKEYIAMADETYSYNKDFGDTENIVIIAVHFKDASQGSGGAFCTIDGIWQISDDTINFESKIYNGKDISSKNKDVNLVDNIWIRTADHNDMPLRFYIYKKLTDQDVYEIRSPVSEVVEGNYNWGPQEFSGFYYEIDDNLGTEAINFSITEETSLKENKGVIYRSGAQHADFDFEVWTKYWSIGFLGEEYFAGYVNNCEKCDSHDYWYCDSCWRSYLYDESIDTNLLANGYLSKVLINDDAMRMFTTNMPLKLKEGYVLRIKSTRSDRIWLELYKNETLIDTSVVRRNKENAVIDETYVYKTKVGGCEDLVVIAVHFKNVFCGADVGLPDAAIADGFWQISDSPVSIKESTKYGKMIVQKIDTDNMTVLMTNEDNTIELTKNKNINLMGDFWIKTSNQDVISEDEPLRFYIYRRVVVPEGDSGASDTMRMTNVTTCGSKYYGYILVPSIERSAVNSNVGYFELIYRPTMPAFNQHRIYVNPRLSVSVPSDCEIKYISPTVIKSNDPESEAIVEIIIWGGTFFIDEMGFGGVPVSSATITASKVLDKLDDLNIELSEDRTHAEITNFVFTDLVLNTGHNININNISIPSLSGDEVIFIVQITSDTPKENWEINYECGADYKYVPDPIISDEYMPSQFIRENPPKSGTLKQSGKIIIDDNGNVDHVRENGIIRSVSDSEYGVS